MAIILSYINDIQSCSVMMNIYEETLVFEKSNNMSNFF